MKVVARVLDGVAEAIAGVGDLVADRLVAVGLAPGLLHVLLVSRTVLFRSLTSRPPSGVAGATLDLNLVIDGCLTPRADGPSSCNPITAARPQQAGGFSDDQRNDHHDHE